MSAVIISVINQKGGAGKTNIAVSLAGAFSRRGLKTLLVDGDRQGTATRWISNGPEDGIIRVNNLAHAGGKIHQEVRKHISDYDYIIVDCPPSQDAPIASSMLLVSDLALIPFIPNPGDLWATIQILQTVEQVASINETLKVAVVPSVVRPKLSMTEVAIESLGESFPNVPILKTRIMQRAIYPEAMVRGDSVHVFGRRAADAVKEIDALSDELFALLA